ncbi:MAG: terminase large subunit [Eubacterium sp.]|nr:terminase large subunit [Candidatus Colimonas fimequi]
MNNYIFEYYQKIQDGSIVVGKWIIAWYEYIIKGLENKSFFYDAKKANKAIKFMEGFAHHHEGALAPERLKLELWQKAIVAVVFGIVDDQGLRQFREILIVIGRKNGKTLFASAIAEYMTFVDGEYGARIYFAAPKLQQANLCYDAFYQMIKQEPELDELALKRRTDVYIESTNSSAQPIAFNANKSDGLNISCCIADEVASWRGDAGLKFYEVLKSSFGARRQPLLINISTAGYENESIYDELMKRATRVILGDSKETRLAPFLYMIDDVEKWNDINELQKSNPNLGVSTTINYLLEEIAVAEGSLSKKAEFITKYCNIKQNSSQAWLSTQTVQKCIGPDLDLNDFRDHYAVCGIDLSQTTDLTSACVVIEKDGRLNVFSKFWLPAEKIDEATERDGVPYRIYIQRGLIELSGENFVNYEDCARWIKSLVTDYKILPLQVGYDRYSAQYLIQDLKAFGFQCDDVYQGDNLYPVICETEGLMKDGRIYIGNNDLLKIHFLNSAIKMNTERGRGKLIKVKPTAHVDGMAALLDAMCVRQKWYAQIGGQLQNTNK